MFKLGQKTIDIIQWLFIVFLGVICSVQFFYYKDTKNDFIKQVEYNKNNTYVRIYESKKLKELKKENKELYDSIKHLKNVESAMLIHFKKHYKTDTLKVTNFTVKHDTVYKVSDENKLLAITDTIYNYKQSNDSVKLNIDIKAQKLIWCKVDLTLNDKLMLINREKDGLVETSINHSNSTEIIKTSMWHKKTDMKWYQRFVVGPHIGVGYGLFNNRPDFYIGVGIGYKIR